jgi:hypothetical protein
LGFPLFCVDIRAFDTLERQGVLSGIAVLRTIKKEISQRWGVIGPYKSRKFAQFFEFGSAEDKRIEARIRIKTGRI